MAQSDIMVNVGADIEMLKQGMQKGAKSVSTFGSKIGKPLNEAANKIAQIGVAAGITAAVGLVAMTKSATAAGRELKLFSQISNTSIQEFQNLSSAAAQFGITNEKLADQLKDVKDRVGDFLATGGGPMADFFEKIAPQVGVTADQFKNLSGADSLQLYISSLEKANLSQAEMTFFLEAMASDLTQLAPLFANNGKLISENEKRINDMGLALSDLDVMALEEGAKAFSRMAESSKAASSVISSKFSPFVVEAVERIEELSKAGGDLGEHVERGIKIAFNALGFLANRIHEIQFLLKALKAVGFAAFAGLAQGGIALTQAFRDIGNTFLGEINNIIAAINLIPGMEDIPFIQSIQKGEFSIGLDNLAEKAKKAFAESKEAMDTLATAEYPSNSIDEFYDKAILKSKELSGAAVDAHNKVLGVGQEKTEGDIVKEKQGKEITDYKEFLNKKLGLQKEHATSITGLINNQWGLATAGTAGAMKNILGTMSTQSRKAFEVSKAWAIGDALVSTYQGIAAGVKLGYPMAIPAVAWASATGMAQVNAIKNQKFGGSGGAAAAGNGAPATAPNPIGVGGGGGGGGAQQGQTLTVAPIDPDAIFSGASMQALANRLADFTADGGTIFTA